MAFLPARKNRVEFANFICKFGELNMLDFATDIVIPAFLDSSFRRHYGDETTYFFHDTRLINLGRSKTSPIIAIVGRFVKDTIFQRDQVYDKEKGNIIKSNIFVPTAPSSLFALILNNHKLLFYPETANAPNTMAFRTTSERFIRQKHKQLVQSVHDSRVISEKLRRSRGQIVEQRTTYATLDIEYPLPSVRVISLSTNESLAKFVDQFSLLESVTIELVPTNAEIDNSEFLQSWREKKVKMKATKTRLIYTNSEGGGLSKKEAVAELTAAVKQGNSEINLVGKNAQGLVISGDNNDFNVRVPLDRQPDSPDEAARLMYNAYTELQDQELFVPDRSELEESTVGMLQIYRMMRGRRD